MKSRFRRPSIFFTLLLICTFLVNIVPQVSLSFAAAQVTVKAKVNLRSGPGTTYKLLGSVAAGEKLTTLKSEKGWLNIQKANGSKGWVAGWLTVPVSSAAPQPSRGTTIYVGKIVTVKGDYANVRSGPATSYSKVGTLNKGQQAAFVKESKGWYNIKLTNGKTGWVLGSLVQVKAAAPSPQAPQAPSGGTTPTGKTIIVKGSFLNVRSGPGTNYSQVTTINKGQQFPVIKESSGWYNIKLTNGNPGWVAGWLVQVKNAAPAPSRGEQPVDKQLILVTGSKVNVRSGPGTQYPVITSVVKGIQAPLIKRQNGWCNIQLFGGRSGWVIESLVAIQGSSKPDPKPPVDSGTVPNPGTPPTQPVPVTGDKFEVVTKKVSEGLQVTFTSSVDLSFIPREITQQNSLVLTISKLTLPKAEDLINVNESGLKAVKTKQNGTGAEITLEFLRLGQYTLIQPDPKSILILVPTPELTPVPIENPTATFQLSQIQTVVNNNEETLITIQGNGPITYNKQYLRDPHRLIFDIPNYEPGQAAEFLPVNSSEVNQVRVSLFSTVPKVTRVVIDLAKPCGYTITPSFDQQSLTIAISGKSILAGRKIVVDPGHGDWDPGAIGVTGVKEKEINLDIANRLVQYLQALGAEVIMTRTNDTFVPLAERAALANGLNADIFVSVHANANTNSAIAGSTTYYYAPADRPDLANQLDNRRNLAQAVQTEMIKAMGRRDVGILQSKFAVLNATAMPSILVETAFLTNAEEEQILADSNNRERFAEAISQGIVNYFLSN